MARGFDAGRIARPTEQTVTVAFLLSAPHLFGFGRHLPQLVGKTGAATGGDKNRGSGRARARSSPRGRPLPSGSRATSRHRPRAAPVEPARLQRSVFLRRLRHAAGEDLFDERAHALLRHAEALSDCDARQAAVQGIDDQLCALDLTRRAARLAPSDLLRGSSAG